MEVCQASSTLTWFPNHPPPLHPNLQPKDDQHYISHYSVPTWKGINMKILEKKTQQFIFSFMVWYWKEPFSVILYLATYAKLELLCYFCNVYTEHLVVKLSTIVWNDFFQNTGHGKRKLLPLISAYPVCMTGEDFYTWGAQHVLNWSEIEVPLSVEKVSLILQIVASRASKALQIP